jgi:hypothetical protein
MEEKTNKDIFDEVEQLNSVEYEEVLEEIEEDNEEELEQQVVTSNKAIGGGEVNLEELNSVAQSDMFRKIRVDEEIPEDLVLTIEDIKITKPYTIDSEGKEIPPKESESGYKYYEKKVRVNFVETINDSRINDFISKVFFPVRENGIAKVPSIPRACTEEMLEDNFTNELSKLRFLYCRHIDKDPKDVDDKTFLLGLKGKKVKVKKETGKLKGRLWAKLKIVDFA